MTRRLATVAVVVLTVLVGCGPRVIIATGTTLGLKATPGDGSSRPPQVTLGYKRAETALIPTSGSKATCVPQDDEPCGRDPESIDAFSTLAAFDFYTKWFGKTELSSFLATGFASQLIQGDGEFAATFADATLDVLPEALQFRREALATAMGPLTEEQAAYVLYHADVRREEGVTARGSLRAAILHAQTESQVEKLEAAFAKLAG